MRSSLHQGKEGKRPGNGQTGRRVTGAQKILYYTFKLKIRQSQGFDLRALIVYPARIHSPCSLLS